jgi:RNA polymerase sigma-70 factor (ECF subfamily)
LTAKCPKRKKCPLGAEIGVRVVTIDPVPTNQLGCAVKQRDDEWAALMRAANAGDAAAYEMLLKQLAPALRAMLRGPASRAGGAVEVEDIVQETLVAIHLKRHTWIETEPLGPWVRAIARHKFIDGLRRGGRHAHVPLEDFQDSLPAPDTSPAYPRRDLERHLDRLPPRQRDVMQAIALDGRSIRETAERLEMTEGAVRVALHRAVGALAAIMQQPVT